MTGTTTAGRSTTRTGPASTFSWIFGAIFVIVGIWGFLETGFTNWAATETDAAVLWFQVNPLHNVVHLLVGGGLLAGAAMGEHAARMLTLLVAVTYTVVGLLGFWATGQEWNILALNTADNWLHLATAAVGFGAVAMSRQATSTAPDRRAGPTATGRHQTA